MLKRLNSFLFLFLIPLWIFPQVFPGRELQVDTTARDSVSDLYNPDKQVKPDTRLVFPEAVFAHRAQVRKTFSASMERLMYFDPMDSVSGTIQTIGQIGKPAFISPYGLSQSHFLAPYWKNPVFGRYDVYVLNPAGEMPYYDTKTNFVNIDYVQGGRSLQLLDGTLSRNITPEWNITGHYKARRSQSAYTEMLNQHRVVAASSYFRSRNNRYHLFANWNYNELQDAVNGGMYRLERDLPYDTTTFFKGLETPLLTDAVHFQIYRSLYVDQVYHLFGHGAGDPIPLADSLRADTLKKREKKPQLYENRTAQRLSLRFTGSLMGGYHRFGDEKIDTTRNHAGFIPAYPALAPGTNKLFHELLTDDLKLTGGASYSLAFPEKLYWNVQAFLGYRRLWFDLAGTALTDDRTEQKVKSELYIPALKLRQRFEGSRTSSTLFNGETYLFADLSFSPRLIKAEKDSLAADSLAADSVASDSTAFEGLISTNPFSLYAALNFYDQNPTVFQTYYPQTSYLSMAGNSELRNSQMLHFRAGLSWEGNRPLVLGDTVFANQLSLMAFVSRAGRKVYYTRDFQVAQATAGESLNWIGLILKGRVRFMKKFYAEGNMRYQLGSTAATNDLAYYASSLPKFHAKTAFFYDNRNVSFAGSFRLGAELHFFTGYRGMAMDAFSGEFFPTDYSVKAYPRLDLFGMMQIKKAYLWVRWIHANEYLLARGYYETPFYPALERTLVFGVNWSVYD